MRDRLANQECVFLACKLTANQWNQSTSGEVKNWHRCRVHFIMENWHNITVPDQCRTKNQWYDTQLRNEIAFPKLLQRLETIEKTLNSMKNCRNKTQILTEISPED